MRKSALLFVSVLALTFATQCTNGPPTEAEGEVSPPGIFFHHVADNQTLRPTQDLSPQNWFSQPESYFAASPRETYKAIDDVPLSIGSAYEFVHACNCQLGNCQSHRYAFSNYSGTGAIEVHDINFKVQVQGCLDVYNFCSGAAEPIVVSLTLEYYIEGQLMGSATWEHFGPINCHAELWEPSFSNLSYSRSEINTIETKLIIGGTPFCQNSTTVTVYALEALCVAGEVHGGGCHCEPEG